MVDGEAGAPNDKKDTTDPPSATATGGTGGAKRKSSGTVLEWSNGYIFLTNEFTEKEVFARKLFGLPKNTNIRKELEKMSTSSCCFLFNLSTRILWGMFIPQGKVSPYVVPNAFLGQFPLQVKFETWVGPYCLKEANLPPFIKNQSNRCMFLEENQTHELLRFFLEHGEKPAEDPSSFSDWTEPTEKEIEEMKRARAEKLRNNARGRRGGYRGRGRGRGVGRGSGYRGRGGGFRGRGRGGAGPSPWGMNQRPAGGPYQPGPQPQYRPTAAPAYPHAHHPPFGQPPSSVRIPPHAHHPTSRPGPVLFYNRPQGLLPVE